MYRRQEGMQNGNYIPRQLYTMHENKHSRNFLLLPFFLHRSIEGNLGVCSEVTLLTCKMDYEDRNRVDFNVEFNLAVNITTDYGKPLFSSRWLINNPFGCRKPLFVLMYLL